MSALSEQGSKVILAAIDWRLHQDDKVAAENALIRLNAATAAYERLEAKIEAAITGQVEALLDQDHV